MSTQPTLLILALSAALTSPGLAAHANAHRQQTSSSQDKSSSSKDKTSSLQSTPSLGIEAEYDYETGPFLKRTELASAQTAYTDVDENGAYASNIQFDHGKTRRWYIEEQRFGGNEVVAGLALKDKALIDRGLKILKWGFDRELPDGSYTSADTYHSMAFFVEEAAHAILLLRHSPFAAEYKSTVDPWVDGLHRSGLWMIRPDISGPGTEAVRIDGPFVHRRYSTAAALGEIGLLTGDADLLKAAAEAARAGMAMQDKSGYNPEKGGYDSSYHGVGVVFAERYYTLAAPAELRPALYDSIHRAVDWSISRLNQDGTMNLTGNTRVNTEPEPNRNGTPKKPAYRSTYRSIYRFSMLSADAHYKAVADKVAAASLASTSPRGIPAR